MLELGLFEMTAHPPERGMFEGAQWDLQMIRWADEYGYSEAWIGEHFFEPWEPCPAPDLLIAQALKETSRIRLGAGAHLLPCHHPMSLAYRVAFLDHLSQGRLNFGVGAAAGKAELKAFEMEAPNQNREKMEEALDIILDVWNPDKKVDFKGKYWNVVRTDNPDSLHTSHIYPFQKPHPPMGIAGFSPVSPSLRVAGRRGFWPMSFFLNTDGLLQNWASVEEGAAEAGRTADRKDWRIVLPIMVADTDEAALDAALNGFYGRYYEQFFVPTMTELGAIPLFKNRPDMADSEVTPAYLAETNWFTGSPETVARKLARLHADTGGFGVVLQLAMDYSQEKSEAWRRSMQLLAEEVMPRLQHLN